MPEYPFRDNLTREQSEALEQAAFLIIKARKEASEMLAQAGITGDPDLRSECHAHEDGVDCPCPDYLGDGHSTCLRVFTTDPGASPPHRSCGHPASMHAFGGKRK